MCYLIRYFEIKVLGVDGFCGWPSVVKLADQGLDVLIVENHSPGKIDIDLDADSLTPITSTGARLQTWDETDDKPVTSRCASRTWTSPRLWALGL